MVGRVLASVCMIGCAALGSSQEVAHPERTVNPDTAPRFEVASVRLNPSTEVQWSFRYTDDGLIAKDVALSYLMEAAFGIYEEERWQAVPRWASEKCFDIAAKYDLVRYGDALIEQRRLMLQQLLSERFRLKAHHESRMFSVYALVLARRGAKFKETKPEEMRIGKDGPTCLITHATGNELEMKGCSTVDLSNALMGQASEYLGREIVDETDLKKRYNFALHWAREDRPESSASIAEPSLFTALEEQLGLQLKAAKAPLDTIVVDHVEMPGQE